MFWNVRITFKSLVKKRLHDLRHAQETYQGQVLKRHGFKTTKKKKEEERRERMVFMHIRDKSNKSRNEGWNNPTIHITYKVG